MPTYGSVLSFVQGQDRTVRRTIDFSDSGFATGTTITAAWLTVKRTRSDADPGLFQKQVSTSDVAGTGQIENSGSGDVDMVIRFDVNAADTALLDERPARWDLKILLSTGDFDYPQTGICWATRNVTTDTS